MHRCLDEDWFLLDYELKLQRVHAFVLEAAGILSARECGAVEDALEALSLEWSGQPPPDSTAEDLHTWVEGELTHRAGSAGEKIHTARSRNDQVATLIKMWLIDVGDSLAVSWRSLAQTTSRVALAWVPHAMPLMTHAQFAAPGSAGAVPLAHALGYERCAASFSRAANRWRATCPLGAGAVAGSSIPIDRDMQAEGLGFLRPAESSIDATGTRDEALECLATIAHGSLKLMGTAADLLTFAQTKYRWITFDPGLTTGSSMMPNKSNPDACELLRGTAARTSSAHGEAMMLSKGLISGYQRDLQCLKPILHDTVERFRAATALAQAIWDGVHLSKDRVSSSLAWGDVGATLRMEARVLDGMPLRMAHRLEAEGGETEAEHGMDAYVTYGSAHPDEVGRQAKALIERTD